MVIAILAAISIVAYTGIQARARTSSGQSLASQVEKKAQAYYTVESTYPLNQGAFADTDVPEAALEGVGTLHVGSAITSAQGSNGTVVAYTSCNNATMPAASQTAVTGAMITYFDYQNNADVHKVLGDCS